MGYRSNLAPRWDVRYKNSGWVQGQLESTDHVFYLANTYGLYTYLNNNGVLRRHISRVAHRIMRSIQLDLPKNDPDDDRPQPFTQVSVKRQLPAGGANLDRVTYLIMDNSEDSRVGTLNSLSRYDKETRKKVAKGRKGVPSQPSIVQKAIDRARY